MRDDALDRLRAENPMPELLPGLPLHVIRERLDDEPSGARPADRRPRRIWHLTPVVLSVAVVLAVVAVALVVGRDHRAARRSTSPSARLAHPAVTGVVLTPAGPQAPIRFANPTCRKDESSGRPVWYITFAGGNHYALSVIFGRGVRRVNLATTRSARVLIQRLNGPRPGSFAWMAGLFGSERMAGSSGSISAPRPSQSGTIDARLVSSGSHPLQLRGRWRCIK